MQVQRIQNNNNYNPNFQAYFVANKKFKVLWNNANMNDSLEKCVKTIADHYIEHILEITDVAEGRSYYTHGTEYRICNHSTGKAHDYFIPYTCGVSYSGRLENMLWELIGDAEFWGESGYPSSLRYAAYGYKKSYISTTELRDKFTDECYGLSDVINTENKGERINKFKNYLSETLPSKINDFLKENCDELITELHNKEYGWKHGKDKKALMLPLIEYVEKQAKEMRIPEYEISEFKEKCLKELDAPFYTNKNKIIEAFNRILNKFDNKTSERRYVYPYLPPQKKEEFDPWDLDDETSYF